MQYIYQFPKYPFVWFYPYVVEQKKNGSGFNVIYKQTPYDLASHAITKRKKERGFNVVKNGT